MRRKLLLLFTAAEALLVLLAVYFEPTYCVRGSLWDEAFFDGRPTSWWRCELGHWEINGVLIADLDTFESKVPRTWKRPLLFAREPGWFEKLHER